jgi:hypothetical protein
VQRSPRPPKGPLCPFAFVIVALGLSGGIRCQRLQFALGRPDRVLAFAQLASRFGLCPTEGSLEFTCA